MWVDYKAINMEMDDDNTGVFHVDWTVSLIAQLVEHCTDIAEVRV